MLPDNSPSSPSAPSPVPSSNETYSSRLGHVTLASILKQAPPPYRNVHHAPIAGHDASFPLFTAAATAGTSTTSPPPQCQLPMALPVPPPPAIPTMQRPRMKTTDSSSSLTDSITHEADMHDPVPPPPRELNNSSSSTHDLSSRWNHRPSLLFQPSFVPNTMADNSSRSSTQGIVPLGSISTSTALLPPGMRTEHDYITASSAHQRGTPSRSSATFPRTASFHLHPPPAPHSRYREELGHDNPYKPPSHTNSSAFLPPRVAGYEFRGGSQAGNMGLMLGRRISDGLLVTGKLHQSLTLLQHEHRILKRFQIKDGQYSPHSSLSQPQPQITPPRSDGDGESGSGSGSSNQTTPGDCPTEYESGLVEGEKYFNRIVVDFVDLDRTQMSILIMRRLGPNLLSQQHHRFTGLDETDGHQNPELHADRMGGSPFPDTYTFLVFCLKAACVLEALQKSNIAHLALSPTAFHWSLPESYDVQQSSQGEEKVQRSPPRNPSSLYHDADSFDSDRVHPYSDHGAAGNPPMAHSGSGYFGTFSQSPKWDVNDTKLRLFDFTHSKILSHERARAPNNIFEWHIPGYLEYHLQFLAPEQTGRAETWMDHRTDIYGLGATLFTLLTMQFPNRGTDSVQILQGNYCKCDIHGALGLTSLCAH